MREAALMPLLDVVAVGVEGEFSSIEAPLLKRRDGRRPAGSTERSRPYVGDSSSYEAPRISGRGSSRSSSSAVAPLAVALVLSRSSRDVLGAGFGGTTGGIGERRTAPSPFALVDAISSRG